MKKEALWTYIDSLASHYAALSDEIFDNPEPGGEEKLASSLLTNELKRLGFEVSLGAGGLETAFRAEYTVGTGGPKIGLLCEYDALRDMGHGCAHHIQGPAVLAAAEAILSVRPSGPFSLIIYGTPDEEYGNGKAKMLKNGCFSELDIALMTHGGPNTTVDVKSMAERIFYVRFHGVAAHAAIKPEAGRSALDALLLAFQGVEFLREHVREDVKMHYTVSEAMRAANVVPDKAAGTFVLRSYSTACLNGVCERFNDIVRGAALMSGVGYEIELVDECESKIPVLTLNELLMQNARELQAPQISAPRERTGSTDFGCVMRRVPGSCIRVAIVPEGTSSHSQAFLDAGKSKNAHDAILLAAKVLSSATEELIERKELISEIKAEFNSRLESENDLV